MMRSLAASLLVAAALPLAALAQNQALKATINIDGGVEYPFDARMVPPTGITVEAWITYDDSTMPTGLFYWPTIARQNITPNQESWNFRVSAGNTNARNLQFIVRTAGNQLYSATYTFAAGEFANWTHVAGSWDGQVIRLFKNGAQVATFNTPLSEVQNNGGLLRLANGDPIAPGRETWNGSIDEVRVWPMARSAAEIAATRDLALTHMPDQVLVFPLDGSFTSEDGTVVGTPFGTTSFGTGATATTSTFALLFENGVPTSNCARKPALLTGSLATLGNSSFTLWCVRGPVPAVSPAAIVGAASATAPPGQPQVFGVDIALDLSTLLATATLVPATDALGNAKFTLPIPINSGLLGASAVFQFAFVDAACGPQGYTASGGLTFAIQ